LLFKWDEANRGDGRIYGKSNVCGGLAMKKGMAGFITVLVCTILILSFNIGTAAETGKLDKQITFNMHHGIPVGHYLDKAHQLWISKVEKKSEGKIKIKLYPSAQLYTDVSAVQALKTGALECAWDYDHKFFTVVPSISALGLPSCAIAGNTDPDTRKSLFAMYDAFQKGEGPGALLDQDFQKAGMKVNHFVHWTPTTGYMSKAKPWIKPADLKGKKIRVNNVGDAKMYAGAGAQPVSLSGAELYIAAQRGTIDGHLGYYNHLMERKEYEVFDWFVAPLPAQVCIGVVAFNLKWYNSLPEAAKKIMQEAGFEVDREVRPQLEILDRQYHEELVKLKPSFKFHTLTAAEQQAWADLYLPASRKNAIDAGPSAVKMYNACQDLKRKVGIKADSNI